VSAIRSIFSKSKGRQVGNLAVEIGELDSKKREEALKKHIFKTTLVEKDSSSEKESPITINYEQLKKLKR